MCASAQLDKIQHAHYSITSFWRRALIGRHCVFQLFSRLLVFFFGYAQWCLYFANTHAQKTESKRENGYNTLFAMRAHLFTARVTHSIVFCIMRCCCCLHYIHHIFFCTVWFMLSSYIMRTCQFIIMQIWKNKIRQRQNKQGRKCAIYFIFYFFYFLVFFVNMTPTLACGTIT